MQRMTVNALSAWHALCHRTALTHAEQNAVAAHPAPLTPQRWRETTRRLGVVGECATVDLDLVLLWFGLDATPESTRRVAGALAHDRARIGALAAALEGRADALTGAEARVVQEARFDLFTERALRIACTAPLAEADACTGALAVALETAPPASPDLAHVVELLLALYRTHRGDARARRAVPRIERLLARIGPEGRAARAGVARDADARHPVLDDATRAELEVIARGDPSTPGIATPERTGA